MPSGSGGTLDGSAGEGKCRAAGQPHLASIRHGNHRCARAAQRNRANPIPVIAAVRDLAIGCSIER